MIATFKTADLVSNLKAAIRAASTDETRAHLECVRIELNAGTARFIATNGHWLWINETRFDEVVGVDEKGKKLFGTASAEVQISRRDAKAILSGIEKAKKAAAWDIEVDTAGRVTQLGKVVPFTPVVATFPPYAQVIPATARVGKDAMSYSPEYLGEIAAAFVDVAGDCGLCFETSGGECDPVVITSDKSPALVVLMPRRRAASKSTSKALIDRYRGVEASKEKAA